jgi:hypothetical protein
LLAAEISAELQRAQLNLIEFKALYKGASGSQPPYDSCLITKHTDQFRDRGTEGPGGARHPFFGDNKKLSDKI